MVACNQPPRIRSVQVTRDHSKAQQQYITKCQKFRRDTETYATSPSYLEERDRQGERDSSKRKNITRSKSDPFAAHRRLSSL